MNNSPILSLENVHKSYRISKDQQLPVLRGITWNLQCGEWAALLGSSGSGKTTLLNLIGLLERPDEGRISAIGTDYASLNARDAALFRSKKLGFIFQAYCLLPGLSVLENVMLPAMLAGERPDSIRPRAERLLARVGIQHRIRHRSNELSGGEQQRAAIARALINDPQLLLADEPTGNLDADTGSEILSLFQELRRENPSRAILMITHNQDIANLADSAIHLHHGTLSPL